MKEKMKILPSGGFFIQSNCLLHFFIITYIHTNQNLFKSNVMKIIKKYVPCKHLLKYYVGFITIVLLVGYMKGGFQSLNMLVDFIFITTILFLIITPAYGIIFTQKSMIMGTRKFYLPYKYIKEIIVNKQYQRITLIHNYNTYFCLKSKKGYGYDLYIDKYNTTLMEVVKCFPEDIKITYE